MAKATTKPAEFMTLSATYLIAPGSAAHELPEDAALLANGANGIFQSIYEEMVRETNSSAVEAFEMAIRLVQQVAAVIEAAQTALSAETEVQHG